MKHRTGLRGGCSDNKLRQTWAGELTRIERSLASMVIDKPTRRITFDD